jgi:hypothetical protein
VQSAEDIIILDIEKENKSIDDYNTKERCEEGMREQKIFTLHARA